MNITLSNHKGGVGKTTSTLNLGYGLAKLNKSVLLIDLDPQANLSISLGIDTPDKTTYDLLKKEYVEPIKLNGVDILPADLDLEVAQIELTSAFNRETVLKQALEAYKDKYDYILVDCPPSLGLLTQNALVASDKIIIPLQAHFLASAGLAKLNMVIDQVKSINQKLDILGVLITQYESQLNISKAVIESVNNNYKGKVFDTKIRKNIALVESQAVKMSIFEYDNNSNGAKDYLELSKEVINQTK